MKFLAILTVFLLTCQRDVNGWKSSKFGNIQPYEYPSPDQPWQEYPDSFNTSYKIPNFTNFSPHYYDNNRPAPFSSSTSTPYLPPWSQYPWQQDQYESTPNQQTWNQNEVNSSNSSNQNHKELNNFQKLPNSFSTPAPFSSSNSNQFSNLLNADLMTQAVYPDEINYSEEKKEDQSMNNIFVGVVPEPFTFLVPPPMISLHQSSEGSSKLISSLFPSTTPNSFQDNRQTIQEMTTTESSVSSTSEKMSDKKMSSKMFDSTTKQQTFEGYNYEKKQNNSEYTSGNKNGNSNTWNNLSGENNRLNTLYDQPENWQTNTGKYYPWNSDFENNNKENERPGRHLNSNYGYNYGWNSHPRDNNAWKLSSGNNEWISYPKTSYGQYIRPGRDLEIKYGNDGINLQYKKPTRWSTFSGNNYGWQVPTKQTGYCQQANTEWNYQNPGYSSGNPGSENSWNTGYYYGNNAHRYSNSGSKPNVRIMFGNSNQE